MNISLQNKNALVCGSTQGIGWATAQSMAEAGANVTLMARNESALQKLIGELANNGQQNHDYLCADFSEPEQVQGRLTEYLQNQTKAIHILVNNTGGPPAGPIVSAVPDAFIKAMSMHLLCNHLLAQTVLPGMKTASYGRIVNVISTSVKIPIAGLGVSNTTRGAVASWAKSLSNEVAKWGITVNSVLPGFTATERLNAIIQKRATKANISQEAAAQIMKDSVPAGRFGQAGEIAAVIAFLASPLASYVNGTAIRVDGGRTGSI